MRGCPARLRDISCLQACCVSTKAASQAQAASQARGRRQLQGKSGQQGLYLVAVVVGMVGITYASVPLYR